MIINKVILENIGIYNGRHVFDFPVVSDRNIILINAKNGSGKTTLLSSIKAGLYGPLIMGHRHLSQKYQAYLQDQFNSQARQSGNDKASITIDFSIAARGTYEKIIMQREYLFNPNQVTEKLHIQIDGNDLSASESVRFENEMRQFWPPTLFDFFLFDGEQIHHQLEEGILLRNIKEAFYSLFNLDLVGNLQRDLRSFSKQDQVVKKLDLEYQKLNNLLEQQDRLEAILAEQTEKLANYDQRIFDLKETTKKLENDFRINGGLAADERDIARSKVSNMEHRKREKLEWLKEIASDLLPFCITKDLLMCARDQVVNESRVRAIEVFSTSDFHELTNVYWSLIREQNIRINAPDNMDFSAELIDLLKKGLVEQHNRDCIHDLTEAERAQLHMLAQEVASFDTERIKEAINNISSYNAEIHALNKSIEINKESDELNSILQKINQNTHEIAETSLLRQQLTEKSEAVQLELDAVKSTLDKLRNIIKQTVNPENIVSIVLRVDSVLGEFQKIVVRDKTDLLKQHFFDCFTRIMHKDNFVKDVEFKFIENNFVIELHDYDGTKVPYNRLSAGEKQVFLLSLTWSLIRTSQRQVPIFLDTLLGRLDQEHRENIILGFLPYVSNQVVVLSTDTEMDDYYYGLVKPYINTEYSLKLDSNGRSVRVTQEGIGEGRPVSNAI